MLQTITWDNVDPDLGHHMVSLGHNELIIANFVQWQGYTYGNAKLSAGEVDFCKISFFVKQNLFKVMQSFEKQASAEFWIWWALNNFRQ